MSEQPHTPTTAEVRLKYESASLGQSASAEFDRWLNEVKAQAWDESATEACGGNWLLANGWTPPVHIPIKEN